VNVSVGDVVGVGVVCGCVWVPVYVCAGVRVSVSWVCHPMRDCLLHTWE